MKEVFCELRERNRDGAFYCIYIDGTMKYFETFHDVAPPENREILANLCDIRLDLARLRVKSVKETPSRVASLTSGYRSRFPEAFATLCAFMEQGPPFEPDEEEEYDEDDEILQYAVVPRVENPWEDDPDFDPAVVY